MRDDAGCNSSNTSSARCCIDNIFIVVNAVRSKDFAFNTEATHISNDLVVWIAQQSVTQASLHCLNVSAEVELTETHHLFQHGLLLVLIRS